MLLPISADDKRRIDKILDGMTIEQKAAHVISPALTLSGEERFADQLKKRFEKVPVGSIFVFGGQAESCKAITAAAREASDIPIVVNADLVNGAGSRIRGLTMFPWQMACGASDDEDLVEKMGIATAKEGRECGVQWTLAPVVDLNLNFRNSMIHTRSFGAKAEPVARLSRAFIRGIQKDGTMAATPKHFPGDGVDEREPHICTPVNDLSREEWYECLGHVWKEVIAEGAMAIMPGHIALPFMDPGDGGYMGPPPASISSRIQVDLLRGELGFDGLVVSDAYPMAGFCPWAPARDRPALNIAAGADVMLWCQNLEEDHQFLVDAVKAGKLITEERLTEATRRLLELKARLNIFENPEPRPVEDKEREQFQVWSNEIADKSITVIRDEGKVLPVKLEPGAKILTLTVQFEEAIRGPVTDLVDVDEELKKRGFEVEHEMNALGTDIYQKMNDYDAVFVNINIPARYGTSRYSLGNVKTFGAAFWPDHPCVIFTSFGDPYKIYEMPYVPNMVHTYSNAPSSQRAAVKVWLGEMEAKGKNPVGLKGFFEMEV